MKLFNENLETVILCHSPTRSFHTFRVKNAQLSFP